MARFRMDYIVVSGFGLDLGFGLSVQVETVLNLLNMTCSFCKRFEIQTNLNYKDFPTIHL